MWELNPELAFTVRGGVCQAVFAYLVKAMPRGCQTVRLRDTDLRERYHPQVLWEALTGLADQGLIRRGGKTRSWGLIWVNPYVIRHHWLHGQRLDEALEAYRQGPSGLAELLSKGKHDNGANAFGMSDQERLETATRLREMRLEEKRLLRERSSLKREKKT